jgi:hypothetical protein
MISGKSFSELCKWVVDPRYPERPTFHHVRAKHGDWVFVNGDFLGSFVRMIPILFFKKYVVVVHNTDRSFGHPEMNALLPHIVHVYAINTTIQHPMLTTIPLGFVDRQLSFLDTFRPIFHDRPYEVYVNFTTGTNTDKRNACLNAVQNDRRVVVRTGLTVPEYYADLCKSKFVLCPEGTGMDTHRVYESLLCGATPVVLRNSLSHLYECLPVCIVNAWTDEYSVPKWSNHVDVDFFLSPQRTCQVHSK